MSHRNARLTPHGRLLIVQRHQANWKQAHIAAAMGVSRKCVKTWIDRYEAEGEGGLADRSSRPHSMPARTSLEVEAKVLAARAEHREGQDVLAPKVGVPARTIARILRRHGVPYLRECDPMTGEVIRSSKATAVRYERDRPGEMAHMDVKKLGKIPDGGGWRVFGRGHGHRDRKVKIGTTTCTRWSMTTAGSPTPRSCPTRRARPALRSCAAPRPTSPTRESTGSSAS